MKNLRSLFLLLSCVVAIGLGLGAFGGSWNPIYSQVGIFAMAGLYVLYAKEPSLQWYDMILIPLTLGTVFSQGLTSLCFDISIFYYIIYRFGAPTEEKNLFGISLLLPLLFLSKMLVILPEPFIVAVSWTLLAIISLDWPLKKIKYNQSKAWLEWFYCLLVLGLYFDNQLYNYFNAQYGFLALAVVAIISHLNKLSMLFGVLAVYTIFGFDAEVGILLFAMLWFEVYGAIAFLLLSPFFTKQPQALVEENIVFFAGISLYYLNVSQTFFKEKYKEFVQLGLIVFVGLIPAFEIREHWLNIQNNFAGQNWLSMLPLLAALVASYLVFKGFLKPLHKKTILHEFTYKDWSLHKTPVADNISMESFISDTTKESKLAESSALLMIVGLTLIVLGFVWLASIV